MKWFATGLALAVVLILYMDHDDMVKASQRKEEANNLRCSSFYGDGFTMKYIGNADYCVGHDGLLRIVPEGK